MPTDINRQFRQCCKDQDEEITFNQGRIYIKEYYNKINYTYYIKKLK